MEYSLEELLPLVEKLTRKYTSYDSSSVTYETARTLMGAVLYCIDAFYHAEGKEALVGEQKVNAETAYMKGAQKVMDKVYLTKTLYEQLVEGFQDFGCKNYRSTIIKGIPGFFIKYNPKFNPQDHILTLDYPTIQSVSPLCGVDAIYQYLRNIQIENAFLSAFDPKGVREVLEGAVRDYQNLFLDNICSEVLLVALGCMISEKALKNLGLDDKDMAVIEGFFEKDSEEVVELKLGRLLSHLIQYGFGGDEKMEAYLHETCKDYAIRIVKGIELHTLRYVFNLKEEAFEETEVL